MTYIKIMVEQVFHLIYFVLSIQLDINNHQLAFVIFPREPIKLYLKILKITLRPKLNEKYIFKFS